jgi:hypothetical protein
MIKSFMMHEMFYISRMVAQQTNCYRRFSNVLIWVAQFLVAFYNVNQFALLFKSFLLLLLFFPRWQLCFYSLSIYSFLVNFFDGFQFLVMTLITINVYFFRSNVSSKHYFLDIILKSLLHL